MNLSQLEQGKSAVIISVVNSRKMQRRLYDLGIIDGARITRVFTSPFRDPIAYEVRNTVVALRSRDARDIYIKEVT